MNDELITLEFDGGSRGNPGPAGIGVVLRAADNTPLITLGRFIGRATNNVAEYKALVTGLEQAKQLGAKRLQIRGDSELIIRQIRGEYRVKHPDLRPLYEAAQSLLSDFDGYSIDHNLRHKNELADRLANLAMDRKGDVTEADEANQGTVDAPTPTAPKKGDRHTCPRCRCSIEIETTTTIRPHQVKPFVCQCGMKMNQT
jgi:ribonuclease HI